MAGGLAPRAGDVGVSATGAAAAHRHARRVGGPLDGAPPAAALGMGGQLQDANGRGRGGWGRGRRRPGGRRGPRRRLGVRIQVHDVRNADGLSARSLARPETAFFADTPQAVPAIVAASHQLETKHRMKQSGSLAALSRRSASLRLAPPRSASLGQSRLLSKRWAMPPS